jgi:hypothetical protein
MVAVKTQGRSWNQRASDDDPTFRCALYADLLVADQVADDQRRARARRTSLEHRIGERGETRRMRARNAVAHDRAIDPTLGLCAGLRLSGAGQGFLEVFRARQGITSDMNPDNDRPVGGKLRVLCDRDGDVVVLRYCDCRKGHYAREGDKVGGAKAPD